MSDKTNAETFAELVAPLFSPQPLDLFPSTPDTDDAPTESETD